MKISKHFDSSEFRCKCGCGYETIDQELVAVLEDTRDHFGGKPVHINSGCRCFPHNTDIGGSKASYHLYGMAADFFIDGVDPDLVHRYLERTYPNKYGDMLVSRKDSSGRKGKKGPLEG